MSYAYHGCGFVALDLSIYAGKYVALDVRTLNVLATAEDPDELLERLKKEGIDIKYVSIDYVTAPEELVLL